MSERIWRGLLVRTEESEATRDEPSTGKIVKVEIDDVATFVAAFPDECARALEESTVHRGMLYRNEREFWSESEVLDDD